MSENKKRTTFGEVALNSIKSVDLFSKGLGFSYNEIYRTGVTKRGEKIV